MLTGFLNHCLTTEDLKSSLESASSELASLRSAHKDLDSKLTEAESKQKMAVDQLAEKSLEFDREKAELQVKREKDADIIKKLQTEVNFLRSYMSQAEAGWDLLNSEVFGKHPGPKTLLAS
jgi:chromosome segregation ATPase